jgi:hypothetical protein
VAISYLSLVDVRKTQKLLFAALEPIRALTVNRMVSRTRRTGTYPRRTSRPTTGAMVVTPPLKSRQRGLSWRATTLRTM